MTAPQRHSDIERHESGDAVILVGSDGPRLVREARRIKKQGKRVALLVGSPDDPVVRDALAEMTAELFKTPG